MPGVFPGQPFGMILADEGDRLVHSFEAQNRHILWIGQFEAERYMERLGQSTNSLHRRSAKIRGISQRYLTCRSCQIILDSSTVPIPPGARMKTSANST